jgi:hypothetical protein
MGFPTCVETKPYPETFRNRLAKPGLVRWCKMCGFMGYTHTHIYICTHTYIYTLCRILGGNKWLQLHLVMAGFPSFPRVPFFRIVQACKWFLCIVAPRLPTALMFDGSKRIWWVKWLTSLRIYRNPIEPPWVCCKNTWFPDVSSRFSLPIDFLKSLRGVLRFSPFAQAVGVNPCSPTQSWRPMHSRLRLDGAGALLIA